MSSEFEARCSPIADHKGSNFSYSREVLLSLGQLAVCKRLPSSFEPSDLSILCEIKDDLSASTSSDSEAGRWHGNLSRPLLRENGILGKGSILKEPKCVVGFSPPRIQGIDYHLDSGDELNNALSSFSQSSSDPDSVRLGIHLSQHSKRDTERGSLGGGALLRNPGCLAGVSAPIVNGSQYYLVNKSVKPYRPPHLYKMNLHPSRVHKDSYPDALLPSSECRNTGSEEEENNDSLKMTEKTDEPDERKQGVVSDEQKGKLDSDASGYPNVFRNDEMIVNKRNQPKWAPHSASCYTSTEAAACKEKIHTSASSFEKGLETKSSTHSPMEENCNVKGEINSCMLSSSNSVDQHTEEEQNPAGGISMGTVSDNSEATDVPSDISANKNEPRSFSSGIFDHETAIPLGSVKQSEGTSVPVGDDDNKIGANSLTEQIFECEPVFQADEKENAINEVCLPDEDSLISLDDLIFPGSYVLTPDNKDHKPVAFNPNNPGSLSHINPGMAPFHHSEPRCQQNDHPRPNNSSVNGLLDPSKNLLSKSNRFNNCFLRPLPHQMLVPCAFPHQLYRMPNLAPSDDSSNERRSHSQQLNHTHNFNRSFSQPYGGPHMPNSGHNVPFGTPQGRQMHPPWPPQWRNI